MFHDIIDIDWAELRFKRAASGLVAMLLVFAFVGMADDIVVTFVLAALFVTASSGDGPTRARLPGMVQVTVYGALIGGLAYWSSGDALAVALVLGFTVYAGTLAAAAGATAARAGLFLTLWAMFALMLGSVSTEPWTVAVAFLVGGAVSMAITAVRLRVSGEDLADARDDMVQADSTAGERLSRPGQIVAAAKSPIGWFAVVRTVLVILGVILGFRWFPLYPLWVAITVIVVVKPSARQSASTAIQRTIGTAVGVAVAIVVAQLLSQSGPGAMIAFLVSAFLMLAFNNANYTLFAASLSAMLVFGQRLIAGDAFAAGWERLLATATGVAIALIGIAVATRLATSSNAAGANDET